jgi:predicted RNase H-like nuclease (RuvC/YqgF family)
MSKQLTSISQAGLSKFSNKSYIFSLHKELEDEKRARQKLEQELDELRKISSEITSHLGIKNEKNNKK